MRSIAMQSFCTLVALSANTLASAQGIERTCRGEFTDMRVIGLTLGDCDLNSISESELKYVELICGEARTMDGNNKQMSCAIKVIASPTKSFPPDNHGYGAPLYHVRRVLVTEKN
jgi:hypothetical protein